MKIHAYLTLALFVFLFSACDIIEEPYTQTQTGGGGNQGDVAKMVLVEEFTGHKCGNCPEASAMLHDLKETTYDGQMITILYHSGNLAEVDAGAPGDKYTTDFRTEEGDILWDHFNFFAVPFGLVDRLDGSWVPKDQWNSKIAQQINQDPIADIEVTTSFNSSNRQLDVTVNSTFQMEATADEYLVVALIEDNVVDWQKDYTQNPQDIPDYNHHDVFRDGLNGTFGEQLKSSAISTGEEIEKTYSYTLPADWDEANCKVVAYIRNNSSEEVGQAEAAAILP